MNSRTMAAPLRRFGLALVISAVAAGGAFAAAGNPSTPGSTDEAPAAQEAPAHGWHHGDRMWRRRGFEGREHGRIDRGFFAAVRQLNITPVQREQMRTILFNAREAVRMERANAQQSGAAQRQRDDFAVLSNPGDPNYE